VFGDVHRLRSDRHIRGHEQRGARFVVAVQASYLELSTVIVVPTSTSAREAAYRPEITVNGQTTRAVVDQVVTLDLERLGKHVGRLTADEQDEIRYALTGVLDL
jgi:mRNA interferase MazF